MATPGTHDMLAALRHPLRRRILRAMAADEQASPRELAARLKERLSNVSYHVRVLAECGALKPAGTKKVRGTTQHFYRSAVDAGWVRSVLEDEDEPPPKGR